MFREKIPARQLSAWLFAATTPPLIQLTCGASWGWLLAVGALCLVLNSLRSHWGSEELPKWLCLPGFLLTVVVLGEMADASAGSWPVGNSYPAVPVILLALGAWSAGKGPQAAARVGAVLFWVVIILYMLVFAAGTKQIRWEWLAPTDRKPQAICLVPLLAPSAAALLPVQRKRYGGKQIFGLAVVLAAVVLTQGILSPNVAENAESPFYEMARSLELLGIAQRFEALVCAVGTVGWFGILTLILSVGGELFRRFKPGWESTGVWTAAILAAGWTLCGLHIPGRILAGACALFWVGLPILTQGIEKIKKS